MRLCAQPLSFLTFQPPHKLISFRTAALQQCRRKPSQHKQAYRQGKHDREGKGKECQLGMDQTQRTQGTDMLGQQTGVTAGQADEQAVVAERRLQGVANGSAETYGLADRRHRYGKSYFFFHRHIVFKICLTMQRCGCSVSEYDTNRTFLLKAQTFHRDSDEVLPAPRPPRPRKPRE